MRPDYKKIFTDILHTKYPEKIKCCEKLLQKEILSVEEVILINELIFGKNKTGIQTNQRFRSYDPSSILKILDFQRLNKLNNRELAAHYQLSRNTISKWKKIFYPDGNYF